MNTSTTPYLASVANDGLLAGRELEEDAELLELYGDTLNRKDKIAFGWIDPDENGVDRAYRTGIIGGGNQESGGSVCYPTPQKTETNETTRFSPKPDKPRALKCSNPQWGTGTDVFGGGYRIWRPCNKCQNCIANAVNLKGVALGRGPWAVSNVHHGQWRSQRRRGPEVDRPTRQSGQYSQPCQPCYSTPGRYGLSRLTRWTPTPLNESARLLELITGTANGRPCNAPSKART